MHAVSAPQPGGGGMALGFRATRSNGRRLLCHGGDGSGFTNFLGLYPDDGTSVVLSLSRGGVQAARSVIANTVLGMLTEPEPAVSTPSGPTGSLGDGLYRSSFWDMDLAVATTDEGVTAQPLSGLVISDGPEPSFLRPTDSGGFIGEGGMLHGFDITVDEDGGFYGGLYPYRFGPVGDIPAATVEPIDEGADLPGVWRGTVETPMGKLLLDVTVSGPSEGTVSTPFAQDLNLEDFEAGAGRVAGRFTLTVPTVGDMVMFPRLEVRAGKLKGPLYAQGWFGELPLPAELEKA
jgi:hypothetical protein